MHFPFGLAYCTTKICFEKVDETDSGDGFDNGEEVGYVGDTSPKTLCQQRNDHGEDEYRGTVDLGRTVSKILEMVAAKPGALQAPIFSRVVPGA